GRVGGDCGAGAFIWKDCRHLGQEVPALLPGWTPSSGSAAEATNKADTRRRRIKPGLRVLYMAGYPGDGTIGREDTFSTPTSRRLNLGAQKWPQAPQRSERPGQAVALLCDARSFLEPPAAAQGALAEAERLRRYLEQLVLADPLQALLEIHYPRRRELDPLVGGRRPHVRELLLFGDVDVEVVVTAVLADDHALVDAPARRDEHRPPLLQ